MEEDREIDKNNLDSEALKAPYLHHKYYSVYIGELMRTKQLQLELDKLTKFKVEYYTGRCEDGVYEKAPLRARVAKQELDTYLLSDPDIQEIKQKIELQKIKCDFLSDYIKNVINTRGFYIRDAISFIKFKNGV